LTSYFSNSIKNSYIDKYSSSFVSIILNNFNVVSLFTFSGNYKSSLASLNVLILTFPSPLTSMTFYWLYVPNQSKMYSRMSLNSSKLRYPLFFLSLDLNSLHNIPNTFIRSWPFIFGILIINHDSNSVLITNL